METVWGRPDLALTVLGEPAAGTAVGMCVIVVSSPACDTDPSSAYALDSSDANARRQIYDVNLQDDDNEPDQFDYNDDDDELRVRGTQLCVTMSSPGTLTLENCNDDRDDDNAWIQDWEFDDDQDSGNQWVRIEDDDDDSASLLFIRSRLNANEVRRSMSDCFFGRLV